MYGGRPDQLPKIPGWNRETNVQIARSLTQSLSYKRTGLVMMPSVEHKEDPLMPETSQRLMAANDSEDDRFRLSSQKYGEAVGSKEHEALQPKVLRAFGYYREAVNDSAEEQMRDRFLSLLLYVADNTIEVVEAKQVNSGLPQGTVIKRCALTDESGERVSFSHLLPGNSFTVFSKTIRICAVDRFTRSYLSEVRGLEVPSDIELPEQQNLRALRKPVEWAGKELFPLKTFMEASLGKHVHNSKATAQFLSFDQDKLRFSLLWDNTNKLSGDIMDFSMLYYLADDTIHIQQSRRNNTGREDFPTLYKRNVLLKDWRNTLKIHEREVGAKYGDGELYTWRDFRIGGNINVYGRNMQITAMDSNTRRFYESRGVEQPANLKIRGAVVERPVLPAPPFTGYGDKFDTGVEWKSLVPKVPKKDYNKIIGLDGHTIRMTAKLVSDNPDDQQRRFVITYFLHDDTLRVYEPPIRNSGIVGGKFLEKGRYAHETGARYINKGDFEVGATLRLNCFSFEILSLVHRSPPAEAAVAGQSSRK